MTSSMGEIGDPCGTSVFTSAVVHWKSSTTWLMLYSDIKDLIPYTRFPSASIDSIFLSKQFL